MHTKTQTINKRENTKKTNKQKHGALLCWPTIPKHGTVPGEWLIPSVTPLEKIDFPSPSRDQSQIASWLGVCPQTQKKFTFKSLMSKYFLRVNANFI